VPFSNNQSARKEDFSFSNLTKNFFWKLAFQYANAPKNKKTAHFFCDFAKYRLMILKKASILTFIQCK